MVASPGLLSLQAAIAANSLAPAQQAALLTVLGYVIPIFRGPDDRSAVPLDQTDLVEETWASVLYTLDSEGAIPVPPPLSVAWTDVPAGSTLAPTSIQQFLSCSSAGPQTTINLDHAPTDGQPILVRLTGTGNVTPVIVNAGAGTTIEACSGALGPGNFGGFAYLPYGSMSVGWKFDQATLQWKIYVLENGSSAPAQAQQTWVVSALGSDASSGVDAGHALLTVDEMVRRIGGRLGLTSQTSATTFTFGAGITATLRGVLFKGAQPAMTADPGSVTMDSSSVCSFFQAAGTLTAGALAIAPVDGAVVLRPTGLADDSTFIHAVELACAYKHKIRLLPGLTGQHWKIGAAYFTPSGTILEGDPGTVIDGAFVGGTLSAGIFSMIGQQGGTTFNVAVANTPGSKDLIVTGTVAPGTVVYAAVAATGFLLGSLYTVVASVPSGGNFKLTMDRPIVYTFVAGGTPDRVQLMNPTADYPSGAAEDIEIHGNGMVLNNSITVGSITIEMLCARNCLVEDLRINLLANGGNGVTFDSGNVGNVARGVKVVVAPGVTGCQGIWIQGNDPLVDACTVNGANASPAIGFISCTGGVARNCHVEGSTVTAYVVTQDGAPTAYTQVGFDNLFHGNVSYGCAGDSVGVVCGVRTTVVGHKSYLDNVGYHISGTAVAPLPVPKGTLIVASSGTNETSTGLLIDVGTLGLVVEGLDVSGATTNGVAWAGEARVSGLVMRDVGGGTVAINMVSTASGDLCNYELQQILNTATLFNVAGSVRVSGGFIVLDGNNFSPIKVLAGGRLYIERSKLGGTGAASCILFTVAATAKLLCGPANNFDAVGFVAQVTAGGQVAVVEDNVEKVVTTAIATTGTVNLSFSDSCSASQKCTSALTGALTIKIFGAIAAAGGNVAGYTGVYVLDNSSSNAFTVTWVGPSGVGFLVLQGFRATGYIDSATGNLVRTGPDT